MDNIREVDEEKGSLSHRLKRGQSMAGSREAKNSGEVGLQRSKTES